jgi:hypothetical protein
MRKITKKTAVIVAGSALLVAVGGGVAFAYWTSTGSGTGTATASSGASGVTMTQTGAPTDLAPGVAPEAVTGTVTNGAANSAYVNSLTVAITGVTGGLSGCGITDFGLTSGAPSATALVKNTTAAPTSTVQSVNLSVGKELAANGGFVSFPAFNIGFANDPAASQDACKGATPVLTYSTN